MAKCINTANNWKAGPITVDMSFSKEQDVRQGENLINKLLEATAAQMLEIANCQAHVQLSATCDGDKFDCSQIQDIVVEKLQVILSTVVTINETICKLDLPASKRHRYFIRFSCGIINQLERLLTSIGRVTDLDQRIFSEDQRKLLICDESISIHTTATIWIACIEIMKSFQGPGKCIFVDQENSDEYSFFEELEFSTAAYKHAKEFFTDLMALSWIQHNRLVKYSDLVKGLPLTCTCLTKNYFSLLRYLSKDFSEISMLSETLFTIIDANLRSSMIPESVRGFGSSICGVDIQDMWKEADINYFIVWHLYSILKHKKDESQAKLIAASQDLLKISSRAALDQYLPVAGSQSHLSPHQEERFKLLIHMLCFWCETIPGSIPILVILLDFFSNNMDQLTRTYFDKPTFRIEGLTVFQLFTKIVNTFTPIYTIDGQAVTNDKPLSDEERRLKISWDDLLTLMLPKQTPCTSKQG